MPEQRKLHRMTDVGLDEVLKTFDLGEEEPTEEEIAEAQKLTETPQTVEFE